MHDPKRRAKHFQDAEASFLIEGLDADSDSFYQSLKARVIAGEIDSDEAIRLAVEYSSEVSPPVQVEATAAR